jgi:hypothetical protein
MEGSQVITRKQVTNECILIAGYLGSQVAIRHPLLGGQTTAHGREPGPDLEPRSSTRARTSVFCEPGGSEENK